MGKVSSRVLRLVLFCALLVCGRAEAIVINEVDADNPGKDDLEFIELYDGGVGSSSLDGLVLVFFNGSKDYSYAAFDLSGWITDSSGFFLLGDAGVSPDLSLGSESIQNGPDAVGLYQGAGTDFPDKTPATMNNLLDVLVYGGKDDPELKAALGVDIQYDDVLFQSLARTADGNFITADPTPGAHNFPTPVPTPEPGTLALVAMGIGAAGLQRLRSRR